MDATDKPRRRLLSVPCSDEELELTRRLATSSQRSMSSFVRHLIAQAAAQEVPRG